MREQEGSDSLLLAGGADVGVANECYVLHVLDAHDGDYLCGIFVAPEDDPIVDFMLKFFSRHVRFGPAVRGNDAFVGLRAIVDDFPDGFEIARITATDHECPTSWRCFETDRVAKG